MAGGSTTAVYAAIAGNTLVMFAKFGAFVMSGSGAMLSEGIHSMADVGNQVLLAIGIKKSRRHADEDHPYGYAREQFVWALISAVGIFFLGCGVTVYHGIHSLMHPEPLENIPLVAGVLVFSLLVEGGTLAVAVRSVRAQAIAAEMGFGQYVREGPDPMGVSVLLEDGAAVLGVTIAGITIALIHFTGNPIWDGVGSLTIGLLLGCVAVFLVIKNRSALLAPSVRPATHEKVLAILNADPIVETVKDVKATIIGADSVRFKAEIEFDGRAITQRHLAGRDLTEDLAALKTGADLNTYLEGFGDTLLDVLGDEIDRLEEQIREAVPRAQHVDLEAD